MECLYYFFVCVFIVGLILLCIGFDYRKNKKWIIPIMAITVFGYLFTWQFRPLKFNEMIDLSNNVPESYKIHLTEYNNGSYKEYSIDSQSLGNDQARKEIWQDIRSYFFTTSYRRDIRYLLPWNTVEINLEDNDAGDVISISAETNNEITIMLEGEYIRILDENTLKCRIYQILDYECIYKVDDYIQKVCESQ